MFCPHCGSKLDDGARFCGNCGSPVEVSVDPMPESNDEIPTYEVGDGTYAGAEIVPEGQNGIAQDPVFTPTKVLGDLSLDMEHRLFKVSRATASMPHKTSGIMKAAKVGAAIYTLGISVAAEAAYKVATRPEDRVFRFDELRGFELLEDDSSVTSGKLGGAIVGGIIFGGVGALVGSSGRRKNKKVIETLVLRIDLTDIDFPCVMVPYITKATKTNSHAYTNAYSDAQQSMASLGIILDKLNSERRQQNAESAVRAVAKSPAEQIKDFKELLDMGILSQEEFDAKKKEILGF